MLNDACFNYLSARGHISIRSSISVWFQREGNTSQQHRIMISTSFVQCEHWLYRGLIAVVIKQCERNADVTRACDAGFQACLFLAKLSDTIWFV